MAVLGLAPPATPVMDWLCLCCKALSLALSYRYYCGVWVFFFLEKDVLHVLKLSLRVCGIGLESPLGFVSFVWGHMLLSLCHCNIEQFCVITASI